MQDHSHEAIISPEAFDLVQAELAGRVKGRTRHSGVSIFSSKIKCADCGGWYGSKVWNSTDKYRKTIYRCNNKYDGKKCETPHVTEEEIKAAFLSAFNKLTTEKKEIIGNVKLMLRTVCATDALKEEKNRLADEMAVLVELMNNSSQSADARRSRSVSRMGRR
ncbi:MAG: zinc ribbon domain-containing protein [Acidaminococcaceae bacterium]|nr:zinc ribbon domain-containing protein [Acidaminococcaceae bacterium]